MQAWWWWTITNRCWIKGTGIELSWIHKQGAKMFGVFRRLIMFKANPTYNEKCGNSKAIKDAFIASNGCLVKFVSCNNLLFRRKTTTAQKDKSHLTGKLVGYVIHVRRLTMTGNYTPNCVIPMEEIAVWPDMVGNTSANATGVKDTPLKSTVNEWKIRVSVCLTAKVNGMKMESFVVFQDAKGEAPELKKDFKNCCVAASFPNGWMNEEITLLHLKRVITCFSYQEASSLGHFWSSYDQTS